MRMPFGKYQGWLLVDVPDEYLDWLLSIDLREPLLTAVEEERADRDTPRAARSRSDVDVHLARKIVDRGYKALALEHHPDRGGDLRSMQELNAATEWLRKQVAVLA